MRRPALYLLIPLCLIIVLFGILNIPVFFNTLPSDNTSRFIPPQERNDVFIRGTIVDDPITNATLYKTIKTGFTLKAELLKESASWHKVSGLVRVYLFSKGLQPVSFGNEVILEGTISKPHSLNNPGLFNYADYLELKNIYCCLRGKEGGMVEIVRSESVGSLKSAAYKIRHRMRALIDEYLEAPYSGFLKAILIGDRTGLKDKLKESFVKTGTVHILAISGLHVGLIAAVFMAIFAFIRIPRKINLALTAALLIFYSFVAGSNPPILRAVIMFAVFAFGYIINREADILNSLSLAALAILLWNPKEIYDPGFQLSFASVASIIIFTPKLNALFSSFVPDDNLRKFRSKVYKYVTGGISVSIAAWLGSFPVIASYFNIISPVSIIANLIAIPILFLLIAASFLFFALCFLSAYAAAGLAQGLQLIEKILFSINGSLANIPFAYFRVGKPSFGFTILYYMMVSLLILPESLEFKRLKITKARIAMIILILFNILVWPDALDRRPAGVKMTALDVGQGDSILIEFPDGGRMLVDGGPGGEEDRSDMGESVVAPFLWNKRIDAIDIVAVTHFHEDHLGGILYVLKNFNVGCVIDSGISEGCDRKVYEEYLRIVKEKNIHRISVGEGEVVRAFRDSKIFVLSPEKNKGFPDANDNSLVLKVAYKNFNILLCGDIKDKAMSRLIAYGDFLKSDIMKVPHHGGLLGNNKIVSSFFNFVSPGISIISVGAANKYGMPSRKTMDVIATLQSKSYSTKDSGTITISIGAESNQIRVATAKI